MQVHVLLCILWPNQTLVADALARAMCLTGCFYSTLKQHRVLVYEGKDKVIKIEDLRPGVSYCIVAKTYVPMLDRSSAYSSRQCIVLL